MFLCKSLFVFIFLFVFAPTVSSCAFVYGYFSVSGNLHKVLFLHTPFSLLLKLVLYFSLAIISPFVLLYGAK